MIGSILLPKSVHKKNIIVKSLNLSLYSVSKRYLLEYIQKYILDKWVPTLLLIRESNSNTLRYDIC